MEEQGIRRLFHVEPHSTNAMGRLLCIAPRPHLFGHRATALSDGPITKSNGGGLTMMMAVHKFRGTPSIAVGTFLWYQHMRPGGFCHFSFFFYPALWWFYEQM